MEGVFQHGTPAISVRYLIKGSVSFTLRKSLNLKLVEARQLEDSLVSL